MDELAIEDRPREKLARGGASPLGDNELLAVLIGHGPKGTNALSVANAVLARAGGIRGLTRLVCGDLARVPGIGPVMASRILAGVELGRRTLAPAHERRPRCGSTAEVAAFLLPRYGAAPAECFGVMLLDARHRIIEVRVLSIGLLDATLADARTVFRTALLAGASAVVAFHNHPSGDPRPSDADLALTRRLVEAGRTLGVPLIDHMILADTAYCSLMALGWCPR